MKTCLLPLLAALLAPLTAHGAAPAPIKSTVQIVDGVALEVQRRADMPIHGKYLVALVNEISIDQGTPPYRSLLLTVDGQGKVELLRSFISDKASMLVVDFRPQPDGLYAYAIAHPHNPIWQYDLHLYDPRTKRDVIDAGTYPVGDRALDGHEPVVYFGDRRYLLSYHDRREGDKNYVDMEVTAVSATTGKVVGSWNSRGQFPPTMIGDYLHFNSLYPLAEDRLLASARSTDTLYVINLTTGKIEDQIDSKSWRVVNDPLHGFSRQHYAHLRENGNLVMYDNRDAAETFPHSRAVEYAVDWKARTLTLVWEDRAEGTMPFRFGWGSARVVANDQVLIGWGDTSRKSTFCAGKTESYPVFSQVTRDRAPVFELRAPCGWVTYRAYFVADK